MDKKKTIVIFHLFTIVFTLSPFSPIFPLRLSLFLLSLDATVISKWLIKLLVVPSHPNVMKKCDIGKLCDQYQTMFLVGFSDFHSFVRDAYPLHI